eukprot:TRINITY_DN4796_c0_g1_i7.p1 TRINITY_DN4796_c0_g1~~TRINITY_DN4796_c0_g1_i7.p1  ORF type:complete len:145 (-),score=21.81 TRINITY_DN4796_c0_g1_i7:290-724(-)
MHFLRHGVVLLFVRHILLLFAPMILGFASGAFFGTLFLDLMGHWTILLPGITIGITGLSYRILTRHSKYFAPYRHKLRLKKILIEKKRKTKPNRKIELQPLISMGRMKGENKALISPSHPLERPPNILNKEGMNANDGGPTVVS